MVESTGGDRCEDARCTVQAERRMFIRDVKPYEVPESLDDLRGPSGGVVELPLYVSPIAVAYNLPGFTGESHVNMTGEVLAKVLSGAITRWNDPALAALNPGAALPDLRIIVVGRSDDSGTTKALTTYLATVAPKAWPHEPEETWPLRGGQSGDGTAGMIQTVSAATGTIG